ncbi:uncharacterized protein LOC131582496 [Poecile atricapillus]|uniref:uncharacterized protein LOC131582496 n=1 Tax=Poecile atricapillus TaxID=48891 RepID=UPI0027381E54|nr:uncharacterized protein LOC131582496 [Poecile atricapillus]
MPRVTATRRGAPPPPSLPSFPGLESTGRAPRGSPAGSAEVPRAVGRRRRCPAPAPRCAQLHPLRTPSSCSLFKLGGPGQDVYTAQCKHGLWGALIKRNRRKLPLPHEMPFSASAAAPGPGTGFGLLACSEAALGMRDELTTGASQGVCCCRKSLLSLYQRRSHLPDLQISHQTEKSPPQGGAAAPTEPLPWTIPRKTNFGNPNGSAIPVSAQLWRWELPRPLPAQMESSPPFSRF